ncbi:MAG: ATP synthase F1 subunit delta [Planctomycetota bacterium]|jgi:F-type H+-transporting ATPase subunit delta|nr:ATP synthase F1 subunit delta [Planctomycetota bacterium]MDP6940546.1 ATP synthase F1 subunit delta [Planctomycetota bacterium]
MTTTGSFAGPAARRYARAIFEAARSAGALEDVAADMDVLEGVTSDSSISEWIADPRIDDAKRSSILEREVGAKAHSLTQNLLQVLARRRRHSLLSEIPGAFRGFLDAHSGRVCGVVETPLPMDDAALQELEKAFSESTGKQVLLESTQEPSLLGGVRVTLDGVRYDGSVRGRLDTIQGRLAQAELGPRSQNS